MSPMPLLIVLLHLDVRTTSIFSVFKLTFEAVEEFADHSFDFLFGSKRAIVYHNIKALHECVHVYGFSEHV